MFFAETLGPAITRRMSTGLLEHVQRKLAGRKSASNEELRGAISEFIRAHGMQVSTDAAIQYLIMHGHLARQDAHAFRLAA
jgi:hypothetical protein